MKDGQRRSRPHQHPDVDSLRGLGQQFPEHTPALASDQLEMRREVPRHDMHELAGLLDGPRDLRKGLGTVDQNAERAAIPGRRIPGGPCTAARRRLEGVAPAKAAEPQGVLGAHRRLETVTDDRIHSRQQLTVRGIRHAM
jgi:hypothetical protein